MYEISSTTQGEWLINQKGIYICFLTIISAFIRLLAMKVTISGTGDVGFYIDMSQSSESSGNSVDIFFVKRLFEPLTPESISKSIEVFTLHGAPLEALYHTLRGVWCPVLLKGSADFALPPRVQHLLTELEGSLQQSVRASDRNGAGYETSGDIQSVVGIGGPTDELSLWRNISDDRRSPYRTLAKEIVPHIQDLSAFSELESM
jgi:hypothetical protein